MHLSVCMTPRCKYKPYNKRKNRSRVSIAWAMHENTGHDGVCACVVWISCHWQVKNHSYLMGCTCSTQKNPKKRQLCAPACHKIESTSSWSIRRGKKVMHHFQQHGVDFRSETAGCTHVSTRWNEEHLGLAKLPWWEKEKMMHKSSPTCSHCVSC